MKCVNELLNTYRDDSKGGQSRGEGAEFKLRHYP